VIVVFENTGIYGIHLALTLFEMDIDFCQLSALEIYKSSGIKRGKSDKQDALVIAQYAISNYFKLTLSSITQERITKLKLLHTQREKIMKALLQFQNNKEYKSFYTKQQLKELNRTNNSIVKNLKKNLKLIDAQLLVVINEDENLKRDFELTQSIPGIGKQTAIYLLLVTKGFTTFDNARQLACFAGVAPFPYQSGTSINGRTKVHHFADKKLKSLLNMCALNAKKYDYQIKEYYERKVADGKNKMLVLNNVRNKLLSRVLAVVKRQQPYVNLNKFAA